MTVYPERITIALPYADADRTPYWAVHEADVDFRNDPFAAERCTLCFAATELARVLGRLGFETRYARSSAGAEAGGLTLKLAVEKNLKERNDPHTDRFRETDDRGCAYTLRPEGDTLTLAGESRVGTLYAAYAFLRLQGVRWYYPGENGEILPPQTGALTVPDEETYTAPAMTFGRGMDIFSPVKDSVQFLLWMARNRMNVCGFHALTGPLAQKLGFYLRIGGHLFEPYLQPDLTLTDGRTIWEAHPEWYGLPSSGVRVKEKAQRVQFCVSQDSLMDYLADILIKRLQGEWRYLDRLDIWGFDTGGGGCNCEKCRALGNGSDRTLHFLSELRKRIDRAGLSVSLVGCAYEETDTLAAPLHETPENLLARDCVVYYPINRCYAHDLDDPACGINAAYCRNLKDWLAQSPHMHIVVGEYYNVHRYEDLPLTFVRRMRREVPLYARLGAGSVTYMHPPLEHWDFRAVNHLLLAELSWDPEADTDRLLDEYFEKLYAPYAQEVRAIYDLVEEASTHIANYRSWRRSVLTSLQSWDGSRVFPPPALNGHFDGMPGLIGTLEKEGAAGREALARTEALLRRRKAEYAAEAAAEAPKRLNHVQMVTGSDVLTTRLAELRRALIYGSDELALLRLVVICYDRLSRGESFRDCWDELDALCDKMEGYYYPMNYSDREIEATCPDALTRTHLRGVIERLGRYR